jgi:hypothetical protein
MEDVQEIGQFEDMRTDESMTLQGVFKHNVTRCK